MSHPASVASAASTYTEARTAPWARRASGYCALWADDAVSWRMTASNGGLARSVRRAAHALETTRGRSASAGQRVRRGRRGEKSRSAEHGSTVLARAGITRAATRSRRRAGEPDRSRHRHQLSRSSTYRSVSCAIGRWIGCSLILPVAVRAPGVKCRTARSLSPRRIGGGSRSPRYRTIVEAVANTTTGKGLKINAALDQGHYRDPARGQHVKRSARRSSTRTKTSD